MSTDLLFNSRRSPVVCLHGCVASSQPLASNIGLDILKKGGNAADAAVAMAAVLAVTEPCSTGIGGDSFCLFYDASTGNVRGLNGSGRTPRAQTIDFLEGRGYSVSNPPPPFHALNVTVPGAAACWSDTVSLFGSQQLSLQEVLRPAAKLALVGFPVAEVTAYHWAKWVATMRAAGREVGSDFLINGQAPNHGQVFRNPALSRTFQLLGQQGKAGIYSGGVAGAIVDVIRENGGVMTPEDLGSHDSQEITPISTDYKGVRLWEPPPNGQGMAALIALNILENFPVKELGHNSASYLHVVAEALKLSLTDTMHYCGDPDHVTMPLKGLLAKDYSHQRSQIINMERARGEVERGVPTGSDTVYFCVVDGQGNACSLVNSNYMGFGTGLVPEGCGFSLQNRGASFSLDRNHGNCIAGGKRPYHTIMAAMLTDSASGRLLCSLGVMGAFMQPQGHVQVLLNMCEFGMDPQQALDAPRVFVQHDPTGRLWNINLEEGVDQGVAEDLRRRGHAVNWPISGHERSKFGRGQVISVGDWWNKAVHQDPGIRVLWAGSDARGDGCAQGF
ncbi:glutathione hydrolase-like YwrD proenzyme [Osmerus eperlanus]|uniref:glutathione hydrolase-like YwrD proenzyme n=1 Tax=Osmerus eperlanus TaxID=29151 RepID=UPI002E1520B5